MDRLFADGAPYTALERLVVLAVARHMNRETRMCFPAYKRLGQQTGISVRQVARILDRHCNDSPAPLLARRFTKAYKSYTYELVLNPEEFAAARPARPPKRARKPPKKAKTTTAVALKIAATPTLPRRMRPAAPRVEHVQCNCGADIARWPDGRVVNAPHGVVTTEAHTCAGMTLSPTNTGEAKTADRTQCPTNTSTHDLVLVEASGRWH